MMHGLYAMGNFPLVAAVARADGAPSEDIADVDPWPMTSLADLVEGETFQNRLEFYVRNSDVHTVSPKMIRGALERQFRFFTFFGMPVKSPKTSPVRIHATLHIF
jgi:hypothetical protein